MTSEKNLLWPRPRALALLYNGLDSDPGLPLGAWMRKNKKRPLSAHISPIHRANTTNVHGSRSHSTNSRRNTQQVRLSAQGSAKDSRIETLSAAKVRSAWS